MTETFKNGRRGICLTPAESRRLQQQALDVMETLRVSVRNALPLLGVANQTFDRMKKRAIPVGKPGHQPTPPMTAAEAEALRRRVVALQSLASRKHPRAAEVQALTRGRGVVGPKLGEQMLHLLRDELARQDAQSPTSDI